MTFERNVGAQVALLEEQEYLYTMQTLALVEGAATALSVPALTADHIARARAINARMIECLEHFEPLRFTELNLEFHSVLFEECPNPHILDLVQRGWNRLTVLRDSSFSFVPGRARESVAGARGSAAAHRERRRPPRDRTRRTPAPHRDARRGAHPPGRAQASGHRSPREGTAHDALHPEEPARPHPALHRRRLRRQRGGRHLRRARPGVERDLRAGGRRHEGRHRPGRRVGDEGVHATDRGPGCCHATARAC